MPTDDGLLPIVDTTTALRESVQEWRRAGLRIGLVPTMGNLHAGHESLIRLAGQNCDRCVVSVFVNPLQFGAGEDYEQYPRTLDEDRRRSARAGGHLVFAPNVSEMYPDGGHSKTEVSVPQLQAGLCGEHRPGHFTGVATVVTKLFNIVQPDIAVFGEKDFQQLAIVRQLALDLCLPIRIIAAPTIRESDGLALSSRNRYLTPNERALAPALSSLLRQISQAIAAGDRDFDTLTAAASDTLAGHGFDVDYVEVRDARTLGAAAMDGVDFVILAAASLGRARLIDNVSVAIDAGGARHAS